MDWFTSSDTNPGFSKVTPEASDHQSIRVELIATLNGVSTVTQVNGSRNAVFTDT